MRLLIDTQLLVWAGFDDPRISQAARGIIGAADIEPVFSVVSVWEVAIKHRLGKADFNVAPRDFHRDLIDNAYEELTVTADHVFALADLPMVHHDPFDRLLVAQAAAEGIQLLTADSQLADYGAIVRRV